MNSHKKNSRDLINDYFWASERGEKSVEEYLGSLSQEERERVSDLRERLDKSAKRQLELFKKAASEASQILEDAIKNKFGDNNWEALVSWTEIKNEDGEKTENGRLESNLPEPWEILRQDYLEKNAAFLQAQADDEDFWINIMPPAELIAVESAEDKLSSLCSWIDDIKMHVRQLAEIKDHDNPSIGMRAWLGEKGDERNLARFSPSVRPVFFDSRRYNYQPYGIRGYQQHIYNTLKEALTILEKGPDTSLSTDWHAEIRKSTKAVLSSKIKPGFMK
ncbi:MAG: hypothetical protein HN846_01160 [Candidatus Pacebacteria bacterium]|nr:hypothetical protein [Candidatus Paceibacterota bacterium]MBT7499352.1 hypothetical protein [Candidatus Paceibacterota bacterium]